MRGVHQRRVPWVFLSCLCSCLLWPEVLGGNTMTTTITEEKYPSNISYITPTKENLSKEVTSTNKTERKKRETSNSGTYKSTMVSSSVSTTTGPGPQSTSPSSTTSAEGTAASSLVHQTQSMETTRETHSSAIAAVSSSTPLSSTSGHPLTEGASRETSPSGDPTSSSASRPTPTPATTSAVSTAPASTDGTSPTSSLSNTPPTTSRVVTSPVTTDTTVGGPGDTSPPGTRTITPGTSSVSATTGPGPQSTSPSSTTSAEGTAASSLVHQTQSMETTRETHSSAIAAVSSSTPLSSTSGHPLTEGASRETSPSGTITTLQKTDSKTSTAASLPSTTSQALTTSTAHTSTGTRSTAAPVPPKPKKGVPLFPYGPQAGDWQFVRRTVDFTSPLFKPQIGFPLGSSLRDCLYFTDNGQIIFPESEYQIFSYSNPPLRGFTGQDPVALVAPFWDDADFSRQGTTFYQEYETLYDEYNQLVWEVEYWIKMLTNTWNYKARWTLKVTWVHAPAYPAQKTLRTNTYQAILSTDGSRSYALFLYQSGGMQWDVTQHLGNPVVMGFSSGDGYFKNSQLTLQPVWEKYRPDQFLDPTSGLRGLQIYKLHKEDKPNYRLWCLRWLKRQSHWSGWGWNQVSCPCSWQQGLWDLRFQPINIGWWGIVNRQLCSFSSWRGSVCCSYGPWGELLEGWRLQSPWQFDQELEPQNWCCRFNDKPSFCALYELMRPRIGCSGYQPPRPAWMFGDPHITTLDGANYTFNGLGDFLLVRAQDRNSSFQLQGRTAQTLSARATNFIAFAAEYSSSSLDPITVQWLLEPNDTIQVLLNNQTVTFETNHAGAEGQEMFNTSGVIMIRNGSTVSASFDGAVTISVIALAQILHASCGLPKEYQNHTEGLMGFWNGNPDDDFRMPNGSTLSPRSSEETLFQYGMTWEINGTSLLGKRNDHVSYNFTPVFLSQLRGNKSLNKSLTSRCNGDEQCIYDALATENANLGEHTMRLFRSYQQMNATLNQYPPSIKGPDVVKTYMGQASLVNYTSSSENVTFTLRHNCIDFKLSENGTLLWTPQSLKPCPLEILARSAKDDLSSVLKPRMVVCTCQAESQCLYNQNDRVGNSSLEMAGCKCDGNTFGRYCNHSKDPCDEPCFPNVKCISGKGCEACPTTLTGDGRHCAPLNSFFNCWNKTCPENYCYNQGRCYISQSLTCEPACTCPPAFMEDSRCFLAGKNFTPTILPELPPRLIQLLLSEKENASQADVNATVAYRLGNLDVRAFLRNRQVERVELPAIPASGNFLQYWKVISEFQYRPGGPVIDFLNTRLLDAVVEAFLSQASQRRWKRSEEPRNNVVFQPISRRDVLSVMAVNVSTLKNYFQCNGYKDYNLVFSPERGFTCVSPCSRGYCENGGQCQHLPEGPQCSCVPFSIYTPWGQRCEHLSMKLGAFFGILFGALGALLLMGVALFVFLHFRYFSGTHYSLDGDLRPES